MKRTANTVMSFQIPPRDVRSNNRRVNKDRVPGKGDIGIYEYGVTVCSIVYIYPRYRGERVA